MRPATGSAAHALYDLGLSHTPAAPPTASLPDAATLVRDRCWLLWRKDLLQSFEAMLTWTEDIFDSFAFEEFASKPVLGIACEMAMAGSLDALRDLFVRHGGNLHEHLLALLLLAPEFTTPAKLAEMLPKPSTTSASGTTGDQRSDETLVVPVRPWRKVPDWTGTFQEQTFWC